MKDIVEIKIRMKGDLRNWEDIPVVLSVEVYKKEFGVDQSGQLTRGKLTAMLSKSINLEAVEKIRWNWIGSYQGHYIPK